MTMYCRNLSVELKSALKKSDEELFWKRVVKPSENVCWTFSGVPSIRGYARFFLNGKIHYAHEYSYELMNEKIPSGERVIQTCYKKDCVNPKHLLITYVNCKKNVSPFNNILIDGFKKELFPQLNHFKLTESDILVIRKKFIEKCSVLKLAREYGLNKTTINDIVNRKIWKHI